MSKEWKRCGRKNRHHLKNKSQGGQTVMSNLIMLDEERHKAWHFLFKNLSLKEVILLLQRLDKIKSSQRAWLK